ncbi:hypothetical protein [Plantactinospora endophytica]|uniref:Uncharacterized protein n=1 Tax=Plantactinospora endophytica TaxID=673535 RepID=A0ABQ4EEE1_9ACTN|nr:hypothetical protein [Plantactinospora endophytica]GIG93035.1 hypothetical protein Pen02_79710 [Plantactinospora endophytica]
MGETHGTSEERPEHRHVAVIQLQCADDAPGFTTFFEPEGGDRFIAPGDHLTITFDTAQRQEIDLAMHKDGLVFWRPMAGDVRVTVVDRRTGEEITDLW